MLLSFILFRECISLKQLEENCFKHGYQTLLVHTSINRKQITTAFSLERINLLTLRSRSPSK